MIRKIFIIFKILLIINSINSQDIDYTYFNYENYFKYSDNFLKAKNIELNSEENKSSSNFFSESCNYTSKGFNDFYKNNKECIDCDIPEGNENAYNYVTNIFNQTNNKSSIELELGKALRFDKSIFELTREYITHYTKYIILLIFWSILFLLFIPFLICIIFKYFCFIPRCVDKKRKLMLVIVSILSFIVIVLSNVAYIQNNYVYEGFFNMVCSTYKIKDHFLKGDGYEHGLSWIGVDNVRLFSINNTNKLEEFIKFQKNLTNEEILKNCIGEIMRLMQNLLFPQIEYVENPLPIKNKIPSLIHNYNGRKEDLNSLFGKKYTVLESYINSILLSVYKKYLDTREKDYNVEKLNISINEALDFFNDFSKFYDSISLTINDNYFEKTENIVNGFSLGRIILFWLTFVLTKFSLVSFILYLFKKIKFFLNFIWILFYLFMLLSSVISFLFGIIGSYSKDLIFGVSLYIDNLEVNSSEESQFQNISNVIIEKCIRGNGLIKLDLYDIFKSIDLYMILSRSINKALEEYNYYSDEVNKIFKYVNNFYTKDIYYLIKTQTPQLNESLKELRRYTDISFENCLINKNSNIYDSIEVIKENCPDGYEYLNVSLPLNINRKDGKKYCIIIDELIANNGYLTRYKDIKINDISNPNSLAIEIIKNFFNSYIVFISDYNIIINNQIKVNNESEEIFNETRIIAKQSLNNIKENLKNFSNLHEREIKNNESIYNIANCKFIHRDIKKTLHEAYYSFGNKLTIVSIIYLFISIFQAMLFIIYYILLANIIRDQKEVKDLTKRNNEIAGPLLPMNL